MSKLAHSNEWFMDEIEMNDYEWQYSLGQISDHELAEKYKLWFGKWVPRIKEKRDRKQKERKKWLSFFRVL